MTDGSSDVPLGIHAGALARSHGLHLDLTVPSLAHVRSGSALDRRLEYALRVDSEYSILLIHRDSEGQSREQRLQEISRAIRRHSQSRPCVPIIPVRMTEAWLLLDEAAIRKVAGRPSGREPLDLPSPARAEAVADPKSLLREALRRASGFSGRRLRKLDRDFTQHRRILLETLDRQGPVRQLQSWRAFEESVATVARQLLGS